MALHGEDEGISRHYYSTMQYFPARYAIIPKKKTRLWHNVYDISWDRTEIMQLARASSPLRHNATVMQHALVFQRDTGQSVFIDDTRVNAVDKQPRVCQF